MVSTMCISFRATTKARGILCGDGLDYKGDCADADKHRPAQLFGVTECKGEKASSACRPGRLSQGERVWSFYILLLCKTMISCSTARSGVATVAQALLPVPCASLPEM